MKTSQEILDEWYPTLNHPELGEIYDKSKVLLIIQEIKEASESRVAELEEKLRDTENVLKNQVRTNSELYQEKKELEEEVNRLKGLFRECYLVGHLQKVENHYTLNHYFDIWKKENNIEP